MYIFFPYIRVKKCDTCDTAIPEPIFGVLTPFLNKKVRYQMRYHAIPSTIPFLWLGEHEKKYKSRPDAIYSLVSYFQKHDTSTIPTKTSQKNAIPQVSKKMRYRAILRYQLARRKYDTNKKTGEVFYSAGGYSDS